MARRHLRRLAAAVLFANFFLLAPLLSFFPTVAGVYQRTRFFTYDLVHQVRAALTKRKLISRAHPDQVLVVGVDETALNKYGRWPWPRHRIARVIETLNKAGALSIAVDILLKEPDRGPVHDLRRALEGRENLPERLLHLREALEEVAHPREDELAISWDLDAKAHDQAWLLDEEGGDGLLAKTLEDARNVVLGTVLEYRNTPGAAMDWLQPGSRSRPPAEAVELMLLKSPELDPERLARDWKNGFFPARFFEQFRGIPLAEVGGVAGLPLKEQTGGGAAAQALTNLRVTAPDGSPVQGIYLPRGIFLQKAAGAGFMNDDTTLDGTVRSIPLVRALKKYAIPSMGLGALAVYHHARLELWLTADLEPEKVLVVRGRGADRQVIHDFPCDKFASVWLNAYPSPPPGTRGADYPHLQTVSAAQVLDVAAGEGDMENLKRLVDGRVVFLGVTAVGLTDIRWNTLGTQAPGIDNHATLVANLLNDEAIYQQLPEAMVTMALVLVMLVVLAILVPRVSPARAFLVAMGLGLSSFGVSVGAVSLGSVLVPFDLFAPVLFYFVLAMLYLNRFENQDKAWIDQMFKRYVSPDYVEQLKQNKGELDLAGREAEITAFFSDLGGFSTFSERFEADRLFTFLGEYLGEMSNILDRHGGTLDKFEGDAVVAFFGAPIPMKDHAARACLASLDMLIRLQELNEEWEKGDAYPELHELAADRGRWVPIKSRIGLNTGVCAIGHLGTHERGNYTMMGDNVNLAARLEGTCKLYDISLCVSESTWEQVRGDVEGREIDLVKVMGKTVPTRIYEVMGRANTLTEKQGEFLFKFGFALEAYKARGFSEALRRFQSAKELEPWDWVTQIYIDRCTKYIERPPPDDWDGVTAMTSK